MSCVITWAQKKFSLQPQKTKKEAVFSKKKNSNWDFDLEISHLRKKVFIPTSKMWIRTLYVKRFQSSDLFVFSTQSAYESCEAGDPSVTYGKNWLQRKIKTKVRSSLVSYFILFINQIDYLFYSTYKAWFFKFSQMSRLIGNFEFHLLSFLLNQIVSEIHTGFTQSACFYILVENRYYFW